MAIIEAKITHNIAGDIKLSANRKGGCSRCAQSKACALTWNPSSNNNNTAKFDMELGVDNSLFNKSADKIAAYANLKVGDTIKLECNEKNLLKYICLLFIPSLFSLLVFSLLIGKLFSSGVPVFIILVGLVGALSFGAFLSRYLLTKHSVSLLKNSITSL